MIERQFFYLADLGTAYTLQVDFTSHPKQHAQSLSLPDLSHCDLCWWTYERFIKLLSVVGLYKRPWHRGVR